MSTMTEHAMELDMAGPVVSGAGPGPSALPPSRSAGTGPLVPGQRWSVVRKREVVLRLLRGEAAEDLARELAVPVYRLEQWRERALAGIAGALKERDADPVRDELGAAMKRIGELTMENELLRARAERPGPLARRRSR
jgi:transposase